MAYFNYILAVWLILMALIIQISGRGLGFLIALFFFKLFPLAAGIALIVQSVR